MYQHLPLQKPLKFTQIGIFGLEINHLATLYRLNANFPDTLTAAKLPPNFPSEEVGEVDRLSETGLPDGIFQTKKLNLVTLAVA
jgi:hypothetical protein